MKDRGTRRAARLTVGAIVLALGACGIAACIVDEGYSLWALNDGDNPIVVVVREYGLQTYVVPPHSYVGVLSGRGRPPKDSTVSVVDAECRPLQQWPVDAKLDLLYVDEAGHAVYLHDLAWAHGLRTAKQAVSGPRESPCP
jgi:hypothetical protein